MNPPSLRMRANAKCNLVLDLRGKRPDGLHAIVTVLQSLSLHDDVSVTVTGDGRRTLRCTNPVVPAGRENLASRAVDAFFSAAGRENPGVSISIDKRIPLEAGLGGGSADAAAVLTALNRLCGEPLDAAALTAAAAAVGADVPFCLAGGTQLAWGVGTELSPLPAMKPFPVVVVKPPFGSSTAEAYRLSDLTAVEHPPAARAADALRSGSLQQLSSALGNSFESVVRPTEIAALKRELIEQGAAGCTMSGSGTAVFGLFSSPTQAEMCRAALARRYREVFLCFPVRAGVEAC